MGKRSNGVHSKKEYRKYGNMNPIGKLVLKKNVQEGNDKEEGIWKYGKTQNFGFAIGWADWQK